MRKNFGNQVTLMDLWHAVSFVVRDDSSAGEYYSNWPMCNHTQQSRREVRREWSSSSTLVEYGGRSIHSLHSFIDASDAATTRVGNVVVVDRGASQSKSVQRVCVYYTPLEEK